MTKFKNEPSALTVDRKPQLGTTSLSRESRTATTKKNWTEMAKMLYWADDNFGRRQEARKLLSLRSHSIRNREVSLSFSPTEFRFMLLLMLVLTTAENRTEELYQKEFALRCETINNEHGWTNDNPPPDWEALDAEFRKRSLQILLETLREYHLNQLADHVETQGPDQLFEIIQNVEAQFLNVLKHPDAENLQSAVASDGSIPETLQREAPYQDKV